MSRDSAGHPLIRSGKREAAGSRGLEEVGRDPMGEDNDDDRWEGGAVEEAVNGM